MDASLNAQQQTNGPAQPARAAELVDAARRVLRVGQRDIAYRNALEATRLDPESVDAWLMRSATAPSEEERLFCLSQANRINPDLPQAKSAMYNALWAELQQDPFLAYLDQDDKLYFVRSHEYLSLAVPKDRAVPKETYPPKQPQPLARAYHWLAWAVLGLTLAGLGTLIFAPLAIWSAFSSFREPLQRGDRIRALLAIFLSLLLDIFALFLGYIFLVHLTG